MKKKQEIILSYFRDGKSEREISRVMGVSRKTVRKYISSYGEEKVQIEGSSGSEAGELIEDIVAPPVYNTSSRRKRKLTEEMIECVKWCLLENEKKRGRGQHKQQMKSKDIHDYVRGKGYDIGYSSICNLMRELEHKSSEVYIRQEYGYGQVCEFDWGEVKLKIEGKMRRLYLAVFTSACGNYRYARLFVKSDMASFHQVHGLFFEHIGGIYREMVYDNMRTVIRKFVGREKEPTEGLLSLSVYYLFNFRFCNVRCGNEKGHVERSVEYVRRKAFCLADDFKSIEVANAHLLSVCEALNNVPQEWKDNKTAREILEIEKEYLLPKPAHMFECGVMRETRVDVYSTISVDRCRYSVPEEYVGKIVTTKVYPEKIVCYFEGEVISEHIRDHGFCQWHIKLEHYLRTLRRKPGALYMSTAFHQTDSRLQALYERYFKDAPKTFLDLLLYMKNSGRKIEEIEGVMCNLESIGCGDMNMDKIRFLCERREEKIKIEEGSIEEAASAQLKELSNLIPENDLSGEVLL